MQKTYPWDRQPMKQIYYEENKMREYTKFHYSQKSLLCKPHSTLQLHLPSYLPKKWFSNKSEIISSN